MNHAILEAARRWTPSRLTVLGPVVLAAVLAGACGSTEPAGEAEADGGTRLQVIAAFHPLAEAAQRVGGERVEVINLTSPGEGPHDVELTPRQVAAIEAADLILHLGGGFQPQVDEAVDRAPQRVATVDLLEGTELVPVGDRLAGTEGEVDGEELAGGRDPHVWVDPLRQRGIAERIRDALIVADPDGADDYQRGFSEYAATLDRVHQDFATGLAECRSRVIVTSHRAFEYLARRYDLRQIPIAGISPDDEPDPRSLEAVAAEARRSNVRVVFFEEQVAPGLAETVAREIGAGTDALDPVETITAEDLDAGADYESIMRRNLAALTAGLECS